jgi:hypothetical protein
MKDQFIIFDKVEVDVWAEFGKEIAIYKVDNKW